MVCTTGFEVSAQSGFDGRVGGGIALGYDNRACDTSIEGAIRYNSATSQMQICLPGNSCPDIGNLCSDGTIYTGLSPDGFVPMYTTPADAGQFAWNDVNNPGYTTTSQTSFMTGQANTAALIGLDSNSAVGGVQPHRAAQHCADLVAHGYSDWYLPAFRELSVLANNRLAIGGFDLSGTMPIGWYWSSTEMTNASARNIRFNTNYDAVGYGKEREMSVRCVRRSSMPPASNYSWTSWGE